MSKRIREVRETLLKTLDDLGYQQSENTPLEILENTIPKYITAKLEGHILDFIILSNEKRDTGELAYNNFYTIYVRKEDKRKD